ncbi:phage tail protein [Moraxella sp. ZY210820]|uniref:phage tail-collar fiber domain-containing protein n=1 Tax=unclassified Moraxella TaxID=2685852 RepID=UPI00272F7717|nr:phage tail protein [Moraxella sp. ZY210820]WLF84495.1 phage tail protein [Moraxella sp. ZY210820]
MSANYYVVPTEYGRQLLREAHQGQPIQLKNLVIGDANNVPFTPESRSNSTDLINQRASIAIQSITAVNATTLQIKATLPSHVGGFFIHEVGLTDINDKLVYIGNYHGNYKPVITQGASSDMTFNIFIVLDKASVINISPSDSIIANQDWVMSKLDEIRNYYDEQLRIEREKIKDEIAIGQLFLTNMPFENGEQVARFKGYGRWKRFGDGQAIVTFRHGETVKNYEWLSKMGATGGAYQHKLTINEMPEHKHDVLLGDAITSGEQKVISAGGGRGMKDFYDQYSLQASGGSQPHNNVQPSIVTGAWLRIPLESDFVSFFANRSQVAVGQTVEFTLKTTLAQFTMIDYEILGVKPNQINLAPLKGQMMVGADSNAHLRLKISEDYIAQGNQNLTVQLVDSAKSVKVLLIDSGETQAPSQIYKVGTHEFVIEPNQSITFDMFAGGGGGGGSRWSTQWGQNVDGQHGGNISLSIAESSINVGGGRGGTGGIWGNGSSYSNGQAGAGGNNTIDNQNGMEILINQRGRDGVSNQDRGGIQRGADVVAGAMSGSNFGGDGGTGVGDERWSYGGAGGSGGHVKAKFVNTTDHAITATLIVGETALGSQNGNKGQNGGFAYAVVSQV